jgi:hypothetical protein
MVAADRRAGHMASTRHSPYGSKPFNALLTLTPRSLLAQRPGVKTPTASRLPRPQRHHPTREATARPGRQAMIVDTTSAARHRRPTPRRLARPRRPAARAPDRPPGLRWSPMASSPRSTVTTTKLLRSPRSHSDRARSAPVPRNRPRAGLGWPQGPERQNRCRAPLHRGPIFDGGDRAAIRLGASAAQPHGRQPPSERHRLWLRARRRRAATSDFSCCARPSRSFESSPVTSPMTSGLALMSSTTPFAALDHCHSSLNAPLENRVARRTRVCRPVTQR